MFDLEAHPAAELFPPLEGEAYDALKEDIRKHGQSEPIVLRCGQILDGRNRNRACAELGVIPLTRELPDGIDPVAFVLSMNLYRRHLNESQRAMIAARALEMFKADARKRQEEGRRAGGKMAGNGRPKGDSSVANVPPSNPTSERGKSRDKAAAAAKVSSRTVASASTILDKGTPELVGMVDRGEVKVSAAAAVAQLPEAEQEALVEQGAEAVKAKAKEGRKKAKDCPGPLTGPADMPVVVEKAGAGGAPSSGSDELLAHMDRALREYLLRYPQTAFDTIANALTSLLAQHASLNLTANGSANG